MSISSGSSFFFLILYDDAPFLMIILQLEGSGIEILADLLSLIILDDFGKDVLVVDGFEGNVDNDGEETVDDFVLLFNLSIEVVTVVLKIDNDDDDFFADCDGFVIVDDGDFECFAGGLNNCLNLRRLFCSSKTSLKVLRRSNFCSVNEEMTGGVVLRLFWACLASACFFL